MLDPADTSTDRVTDFDLDEVDKIRVDLADEVDSSDVTAILAALDLTTQVVDGNILFSDGTNDVFVLEGFDDELTATSFEVV